MRRLDGITNSVDMSLGNGSEVKASASNAGDLGSIPGLGRSGEGNGNPLQYSCLENPVDRGAWQILSNFTFLYQVLTMCWKTSIFIPSQRRAVPKNVQTTVQLIALISHTSKVMLRILRARFQQYVNRELPDVQAGFRKGRGTRDQIARICWIIEKAREFQKNIYFCFIDCVDHNKLWKVLQEMRIPDHLTCLLRNLCGGQEATVKTRHETMDWFQVGKGVRQGCIQSPCLLTSIQSISCKMLVWIKHSWNQDYWEKHQQPQISR